jgi:hypothetical protein
MRHSAAATAVLVVLGGWAAAAQAVTPYVQFDAGYLSRDVVEEGVGLDGFTFSGSAQSTRLLATLGVGVGDFVTLYAQGGAADLAIDDFNGFDASMDGAYGGGVRLNFLMPRNPFGMRLFVDGSVLHTEAQDKVQAEFGCTAANGCTDAVARAQGAFLPRLAEESIDWTEYTVLLGVGSTYRVFGLYGGVRLSWVDATDTVKAAPDANFAAPFRFEGDLKEQDNFGVFVGSDLFLERGGRTALNIEVSLFDQDSIRVGIRRTF